MRKTYPGSYRGDGRVNVNRQPGYQIVSGEDRRRHDATASAALVPGPTAAAVGRRHHAARRSARGRSPARTRSAANGPLKTALRSFRSAQSARGDERRPALGRVRARRHACRANRRGRGLPGGPAPGVEAARGLRAEVGVRRSSRRSRTTPARSSSGRLVVGVVNFPPKQIGPVRSECLVLGTYSSGRRAPARAGGPRRARRPGGLATGRLGRRPTARCCSSRPSPRRRWATASGSYGAGSAGGCGAASAGGGGSPAGAGSSRRRRRGAPRGSSRA